MESGSTFRKDHNRPPETIEMVSEVVQSISAWLAENPVIETEEKARQIKLQIDRAKLLIKDLEDERVLKVKPLNNQVTDINFAYKKPKSIVTTLLDELQDRLGAFIRQEEERRIKLAEEASRKAREAEERAREAEKIEKEQLDNAAQGEVGVDVAQVIANADEAFEDYQRAEREAIMARKDTHVKVGGGFARAISLRDKEILDVVDAIAALTELGVTENIKMAILTSARAYRKIHNRLPQGISSTIEKVL